MGAYSELGRRFAHWADIRGAISILHWDQEVMMPAGAAPARAQQMAALEVTAHGLLTDPALDDLLAAAEDQDLAPWDRANLREMTRRQRLASALDADLVAAFAMAATECAMAWRQARPANDYAAVRPLLENLLRLVRERAAALGAALDLSPYDALIAEWDPGSAQARIDPLFDELADFLPPFLEAVLARQAAGPALVAPKGPFPQKVQQALGLTLARGVGFDFARGRMDVSAHPFCGGVPDDIRMTTRYNESDALSALMGVLHESGHALYEAQLPAAWRRQPVGQARGMTAHESQSLIIEMQAARGPEYASWLAGQMEASFPADAAAFAPDNLMRLLTRVERSLIRVEADEVTYPLHVVLRYRLEQALIGGALTLGDLPAAWNDGMRDLLGVDVPDDRRGCLQDMHWYDGGFGYFPSYTLGALMAAQLYEAARAALPDLGPSLARGDFGPLRAWLGEKIHGQACLHDIDGLVTSATGRALSTAAFRDHLARRYLGGEA